MMRSIVVAATALALAGCGGGSGAPEAAATSDAPPFSIERDGNYVPGINPVGSLRVDLSENRRDGNLIAEAGNAAKSIGERWNNGTLGFERSIRAISVVVRAPRAPTPENGVGPKILHLSFDPQILGKTVHFGADPDTVLASATEVGWWTPNNDDVVGNYCNEHADGEFCRKFWK